MGREIFMDVRYKKECNRAWVFCNMKCRKMNLSQTCENCQRSLLKLLSIQKINQEYWCSRKSDIAVAARKRRKYETFFRIRNQERAIVFCLFWMPNPSNTLSPLPTVNRNNIPVEDFEVPEVQKYENAVLLRAPKVLNIADLSNAIFEYDDTKSDFWACVVCKQTSNILYFQLCGNADEAVLPA